MIPACIQNIHAAKIRFLFLFSTDKKDWATSDKIRDELVKLGITIKDTNNNTHDGCSFFYSFDFKHRKSEKDFLREIKSMGINLFGVFLQTEKMLQ
jgi:hypothetical protein